MKPQTLRNTRAGVPNGPYFATWQHGTSGFKELLQRYKIDPNNPITSEAHLRDTLLRKIKPVAVLRHAFLKPRTTGSGGVVLCGLASEYRLSWMRSHLSYM